MTVETIEAITTTVVIMLLMVPPLAQILEIFHPAHAKWDACTLHFAPSGLKSTEAVDGSNPSTRRRHRPHALMRCCEGIPAHRSFVVVLVVLLRR